MSESGLTARRHPLQVAVFSIALLAATNAIATDSAASVQPPTTPSDVTASARSGTELSLVWRESADDAGVAGYEVLRNGSVVATVRETRALVSGLKPESQVCVAVRAFDAAGNRSAPSPEACARTVGAASPAAPLNVRVEPATHGELRLAWDPSPSAGVVYVVTWDGSRRGQKAIGTTPSTTFKVFGMAASQSHCYRVVARDQSDRESPASVAVCAAAGEDGPLANPAERTVGSGGPQ